MAEAPSLSTSTRSIAASGIEFRSTALPFAPWFTIRRPFNSTRVLEAPSPRRLALELPLLLRSVVPCWMPTFEDRLSAPVPFAEIDMSSCSALVKPRRSMSWRVMTCTGSAPWSCTLLMLLPVISMRSDDCARSCAAAPPAMNANDNAWTSLMGFTSSSPCGIWSFAAAVRRIVRRFCRMCRNITNGLPILASEMLTRFLTCLLLLSSVPTAKAALPQPMRGGLGAAGIPEEAVGVMVVRFSDGATVLAHRERESMQPASPMKLVTSLATLEKLGPAYRARTQLRSRGELADGVLHGNLVLRGGGDVDFDWRAFEHALSMLRAQGIREIEGDLIVDLTYFRPARADIGAVPFDGTPQFRYNVIPDALLLNTYLLQLDINSRAVTVRMVIAPALAGVSVVSELTPVERACDDWEDGWKLPAVNLDLDGTVTIRIRGEFPRDCTASTEINVIDRMAFVDRLFRSLWTHMG